MVNIEDGIFPHECEEVGCAAVVQYDDEPKCFTHSPDSGSFIPGYSARAKAQRDELLKLASFEAEATKFDL